MDFRTVIKVKASKLKIDLNDSIVTIGSCFSDDIGQRFMDNKFRVSKNPFGTVYNPLSIHKLLMNSISNTTPSPIGYLERDSIFFHYDFHSQWYGHTKGELAEKLIKKIHEVRDSIKSCKHLIVTYGTSWVYEEKNMSELVANCHKVPQANFSKFLLTQKRIVESFENLYRELKNINKQVRIILTVSPVRHIKDTIELNSVSKSILRLTCHTLTEAFADVEYFPSYEIMMDDLRDYRFYAADLIHPSGVAVDYIWREFTEAYLSEDTKSFVKEWSKLKSAVEHKPFVAGSKAHQKFVKELILRLDQLGNKVDVAQEIEHLRNQIN